MDSITGPMFRLVNLEATRGLVHREIWIGGSTIVRTLQSPSTIEDDNDDDDFLTTLDCCGLIALPGLVDLHAFVNGDSCPSCGQTAFMTTSIDEEDGGVAATVPASELLGAGITTFVGVSGRSARTSFDGHHDYRLFSRESSKLAHRTRLVTQVAGGLRGLLSLSPTPSPGASWAPSTAESMREGMLLVAEAVAVGLFAVTSPPPIAFVWPTSVTRSAQRACTRSKDGQRGVYGKYK